MNALFIFPPYLAPRDAGGQIQRHFIKGLDGITPYILCLDSSLEILDQHIYKIKESRFFYLLYRALHHYNLATTFLIPDQLVLSWKRKAQKIAGKIIDGNKIDYIHSINNPCTSHLIAYNIKKQTGLPWIAQLYDPWHNNPFRKFKIRMGYNKDARYERLIAENADAIIVPNDSLAEYWIETYGLIVKQKLHVIPFVTARPQEMGAYHITNETIVISHIGTLSAERSSKDFIAAISQLLFEYPDFRQKLRVNYVGNVSNEEKSLIDELKLSDIFNLTGNLTESQCIEYYINSSIYLIIDINVEPNVFYPSKLLKYFCYKKPILAIVTEKSTVAEEMRKTGNFSFKYGDILGIKKFLYQAITDYNSILTNDRNYWTRFMVENVVLQYKEVVKEIIQYK